MGKNKIKVTLQPENQPIQAQSDQPLLEAMIDAGILLRADCGGKGKCAKCRIQISDESKKSVSTPTDAERRIMKNTEIENGYRLACQVSASESITVSIPEQTRLKPEVAQKGPTLIPVLEPVTGKYKTERFGIAVDLGTTTIAVYLCDINRRKVLASVSLRNPQVIYGDDVMSRITAVYQYDDLLAKLHKSAVQAIEWGIYSLCRSSQIQSRQLAQVVVVGNSTMIHLFANEDPSSIGVYPYEPKFKDERTFAATSLGFSFNADAVVTTLPLISGFLGSDIVAASLAADHRNWPNGTMLIDVGTNGEVILLQEGQFTATSCATGPAFEGASIHHGMHAISGAIDAVKIDPQTGRPRCSLIQKDPAKIKKPSGICGSGVVSAIAELYRCGILLKDGRILPDNFPDMFVHHEDQPPAYVLVPAEQAQANRAVTLTQADVRAIQLAKGALYTGISLLCMEMGIEKPTRILIAGAFGSYINIEDALTIGLFPEMDPADVKVVGNAAGAGAILALFDDAYRQKALVLSREATVVDLGGHPQFQDVFMNSLAFPNGKR